MAELTSREREILQAYADNDMNMAKTANVCFVAYNSVEYHFDKIKRKTGLNPKCFYDLVKLMEVKGNG